MTAPAQDRRAASVEDTKWREHVDTRLTTQDGLLNSQGALLTAIDAKLDAHIKFAKEGFAKTEPVVEAMETMQTGIKVIGWLGKKTTAIGAFFAAVVTAFFVWKDHWK